MSINSLKIRGIRSFGPRCKDMQTIEFHPLTLILGKNGSGKTTVIEALKYITSGTEPPHSESRRNFVHDPRISKLSKVTAIIELDMTTINKKSARAIREIKLDSSAKGTPTVSSFFEIGGACHGVNKQDDWGKTIANQLGIPNLAVLNYILFCHQDSANWFLGDAADVKQKFDDILDCQVYKRALKYIKDYRRKLHAHLQTVYANISHSAVYVSSKTKIREQIDFYKQQKKLNDDKIVDIVKKLNDINAKIMSLKMEKSEIEGLVSERSILQRDMANIQREISTRKRDLGQNFICSTSKSDSDLKTEYDHFENNLKEEQNLLEQQKSIQLDLKRKKISLSNEIVALERDVKEHEVKEGVLGKERESLIERFQEAGVELTDDDLLKGLSSLKENLALCKEQNETNKCLEDDASRDLKAKSKKFDSIIYDIRMKKKSLDYVEQRIQELRKPSTNNDGKLNPLQDVVDNLNEMHSVISKMREVDLAKNLDDLVTCSKRIVRGVLLSNDEQAERLDREAEAAKAEIMTSEAESTNLKLDVEEAEKFFTQAREKLKSSSNQLNNLSWVIRDIERKVMKYDTDRQMLLRADLSEKRRKIESKRQTLEDIENSLEELSPKILELYRTLEGSKSRFNTLRENKTIRDKEVESMKIKTQIDTLDMKMSDKRSMDSIVKELDTLERAKAEELMSRSKFEGSNKEIKENINRSNRLLDDPKVQQAYKNRAKLLGEKEIHELLIKDLDLLYKCFDQSVTRFHNEVLRQINIALDNRWRRVYQGQDVETIMLVADEESQSTAEKRKYNYHIAMVRDGVKMRMRERSSAGQKALASIIIRIALAELFARDFGVLAFDEPTANLDKANVASLAKIISALVKNGLKKGHNMQWIIITHDESFLKALDKHCSPYYYVIDRDTSGYSRIRQHINNSIDSIDEEN